MPEGMDYWGGAALGASVVRFVLPDSVAVVLFMVAVALALAPYLPGTRIGNLDVPRLSAKARTALRIVGPFLVLAALVPFLDMFPEADETNGDRPVHLDRPPPAESLVVTGTDKAVYVRELPEATVRRRLVVTPFVNNSGVVWPVACMIGLGSGSQSLEVDRVSWYPRDLLEHAILQCDALHTVILLDQQLGEEDIQGTPNAAAAVRLCRKVGANTIILGKVLDLTTDPRGIPPTRRKTETRARCRIVVQVIDAETAKVLFSRRAEGVTADLREGEIPAQVRDGLMADALEEAIRVLIEEGDFLSALTNLDT